MNPPQSWLVVDLKHHWAAVLLAMIAPKLSLDGERIPVRWGRNEIPVRPGRHHLRIHVRWIGRAGEAAVPVSLDPGETVELEYRAPLTVFHDGALGPAPQPWNGMGAVIALALAPLAIMFVLFLLLIIIFAVAF